jgi:DNA-binding NarL/FixJ family response regulator
MDIINNSIPDIVLLDIHIKGDKDGIDIAQRLNDDYRIPFIYLTSYADKDTIDRAKTTMPYGYIIKPFDERDLLSSIEMALYRFEQQNGKSIPSLSEFNDTLGEKVTGREYELLCALAQGLTNQEIAEQLFISLNTVKFHLKNLFAKIDVSTRSAAVAKLYKMK